MVNNRLVSVVAIAALLAGCTSDPDAPESAPAAGPVSHAFTEIPEVVQRVEPSVVTIFAGSGSGSGVVYKADGVIVTNAHVVGEAARVEVAFADGRRLPGTVMARDKVTDLALVRTSRKDLPAAKFVPGLPRPGELVMAMGAPLGFTNSVTAGIVSGLGREIPGSASRTRALVDLIQTDAAISPGNSGGALVNIEGEVVGINEAYIPPQAGAVSLGFAIPAATVTDVADELLATGKASHPYLGIVPTRITSQIADALDLRTSSGVLVRDVAAKGPAAGAGVEPGDVMTRFNGQEVRTVEEFLGELRDVEPGEKVRLDIRRQEETLNLALTAGELPS